MIAPSGYHAAMLRTLACLILATAGCATIASGPYGAHLDAAGKPSAEAEKAAKLKISASEVTAMSSRYFAEIEFTLENPTAQWVRVEKVALDFGGEKANQSVSFPWGAQLENWAEATHYRNLVRQINDAMALELIGAGAAVLSMSAAHGHGGGSARVAGGLATMAVVAGIAGGVAASTEAGSVAASFGGQHLFAVPLEVPPGLFVKRYVVVNTPDDANQPCLANVVLAYELADHTTHRVALTFRTIDDERASLEWQRQACFTSMPPPRWSP